MRIPITIAACLVAACAGSTPTSPTAPRNPTMSEPVIDTTRAPQGVYLIDTFRVPVAARAELETAMRRNRELLHTLDGFRGDAVFERAIDDASFELVTVAAWDSPDAIARAKDAVHALYQRIGFDMQAALRDWKVTMSRGIYRAPGQLADVAR
jgi:hypothetical protein